MIELFETGAFLQNGTELMADAGSDPARKAAAKKGTITYSLLQSHNTSNDMQHLKLKFDSLASHDITFVGIIQTAKASGMTHFPIPYVLTNCHNSLCAVGGTINEDDHIFGLTAAKHYGGILVPPHIAVIHQYMREQMAGCGRMILGSDSHTRYGALGTLAIGEGGGELVKQLLCDTYDIDYPNVVAIYLEGRPQPGVGPHDVALAIIRAVFKNGYVKNSIMEFVGPGISAIDTDFRNGIDVMTTETTCLSSIWRTDEDTRAYLTMHGRPQDYQELNPAPEAYYDGVLKVNLSTIKPMIALPFHPSNAYEIDELNANLDDILRSVEIESGNRLSLTDKIRDGALWVQQGIIAGCAGGNYTNVMEAAHILNGKSCGHDIFSLAVYPSSQPVFMDLVKKGAVSTLMAAGATVKTAFCGPCFGAGDTPANQTLSIRHTTRNFPSREGSKPGSGQMAAVALMDARSIAATAVNGGKLTPAAGYLDDYQAPPYEFDDSAYKSRVYHGYGQANREEPVVYGPNIKDWPEIPPLADHILLKVCAKILDEVTTTDELIPSGETSSYRSNPLGLAEFTLSRRVPEYVARAKAAAQEPLSPQQLIQIQQIPDMEHLTADQIGTGSVIYAQKPGDGSAREQAASCQRVLGGAANIAREYATKRYRSNMINWGMLPFLMTEPPSFEVGDYLFIPNIKSQLNGDMITIPAYILSAGTPQEIHLSISPLTPEEKAIIKAGCLINYNKTRNQTSN